MRFGLDCIDSVLPGDYIHVEQFCRCLADIELDGDDIGDQGGTIFAARSGWVRDPLGSNSCLGVWAEFKEPAHSFCKGLATSQ